MSIKTVEIYHGDDARKPMLAGINKLARAVGSTLGAQGKNVIIEKGTDGRHQITKDGVTVAKSIYLKDELENLGAQMVRTVTEKTGNFIGDGTTSSTILIAAMCNEGYELIKQGLNTVELKKGLEFAVSKFQDLLENYVITIPDNNEGEVAYKIAKISSNYDEDIASTLRDTFKKVGKNGVIVVDKEIQTSEKTKTMHLDLIEGFRVESGYIHNQFIIGNNSNRWEANDCRVLVLPMDITNFAPIHSIVEQCASKGEPLLIIANDFTGDSVIAMVQNNARGSVKVCGIKSPSVGEERAQILEDICIYTGATYHKTSDGRFRGELTMEFLGTAAKVIVERTHTTILGGKGHPITIAERVQSITADIESGTLTAYQRTYYLARKAQLLGQVAMIKVLGATDTDLSEKLDRVDDAVHATKSAITYGYVAGGGATLFRISYLMEDLIGDKNSEGFNGGISLFIKALRAPISRIISNATGVGDFPTVLIDKTIKNTYTNQSFLPGATYVLKTILEALVIKKKMMPLPKNYKTVDEYLAKIRPPFGCNTLKDICFNDEYQKKQDNAIDDLEVLGFDANTCTIVDMLEENIIDPYEVVKYSVIDAAAVASTWITTDTTIINTRKDATEAMRDVLLGNIV